MRIAVLGAGAWGTAMAIALSKKHQVALWSRDPALVAEVSNSRLNQRYLPDLTVPVSVVLTDQLRVALGDAELIVVAVASSGLASTISATMSALPKAPPSSQPPVPILWLCKGFIATLDNVQLPHEVAKAQLGARYPIGALSGPSFAQEVALGLPVALTLASDDLAFAKQTAVALSGHALRVYASDDLIGVELGGALKNVMAIAAGIGDGLALGLNARAALITRGLAEMVRLGVAMGGRPDTFMGLTGVGDLILTATGNLSRNRRVGLAMAQSNPSVSLDEVLRELGHVAEGVNSTRATLTLARQYGVEMPITEAVHAVLFDGASAAKVVQQLLARDVRVESAQT